ncbi:MAG: DUF1273 family protein [Clostridia bacterium]|nr:DUF1273 family protein [Clostridia bacterium]
MCNQTCCFTGHRFLPKEQLEGILRRLSDTVDGLIAQGVTRFISGGALGFDQLAARVILHKRDIEKQPIRLIIAQPCRDQAAHWTVKERAGYENILAQADEVVCLSEHYFNGCMHIRNRYMVEHADHVIACMARLHGGTAQTVSYAVKKGLTVVNIWE